MKQPKPFFQTRFGSFIRLFVGAWPAGILPLVTLWPELAENSLNAIKCLCGVLDVNYYEPDFPAIAIWCMHGVWGCLFLKLTRVKEKELQKEKDEQRRDSKTLNEHIKSQEQRHNDTLKAIFGRNSSDILILYHKYFEAVFIRIQSLKEYSKEFEAGDYTNIIKLENVLMDVREHTKIFVSDFFRKEGAKIGVNYMLYFDRQKEKSVVDKLTKNRRRVGYRKKEESHLVGTLYLTPKLNSPILHPMALRPLSIPVYAWGTKVYNAPKCDDLDVTLPGAPMAFFHGKDIISNTMKIEDNTKISPYTQKELTRYFGGTKVTGSLISYRIPVPYGKEGGEKEEGIGVFNIEANRASFFTDDEQYSGLYLALSSIFSVTSECLYYYKDYLRKNLLTS